MYDDDDKARLRWGLNNLPPKVREAITVATEHRLASERIRKRALKAMVLEKAAVWRRFLRRRLPSNV